MTELLNSLECSKAWLHKSALRKADMDFYGSEGRNIPFEVKYWTRISKIHWTLTINDFFQQDGTLAFHCWRGPGADGCPASPP